MQDNEEKKTQHVEGKIDYVIHISPDSGFCVLSVVKDDGEKVKIVGTINETPKVGLFIEAYGHPEEDRRQGGEQLRAHVLFIAVPPDVDGIRDYLGSGIIPGIGPKLAGAIVERFGEKTFEVLDATPGKLLEVEGIGAGRYEKITTAWKEKRIVRDLVMFLQPYGIKPAMAARIFRFFGSRAMAFIQENPYILTEIPGIGFETADKIAMKMGIAPISQSRLRAGLSFTLAQQAKGGHCAAEAKYLLAQAQRLLRVPDFMLTEALSQCVSDKVLVREDFEGTSYLYLPKLYRAELETARHLKRILNGISDRQSVDIEKVLNEAQVRIGKTLCASQQDAVRLAAQHGVMVVTGGPGTGKSTTLAAILDAAEALGLKAQTLCAPTGKAANRMSETTHKEAGTVHRTLGIDGETGDFIHNEDDPLDADLVVVDESSMLDVHLAAALFAAIPTGASLILLGDVDQLPSVGPGNVLRSIIDSGVIPTVCLAEIMRQSEGSMITVNAHRMNQGMMPVKPGADQINDFFFLNGGSAEEIQQTVVDLVTTRLPAHFGLDPARDIQVLTPTHKESCGTKALNEILQQRLVPAGAEKISRYGKTFYVGDRVMQVRNNYDLEVFNGSQGYVKSVDPEEGEMVVTMDGKEVLYSLTALDDLMLAYAGTVHKSQGSEYKCVILVVCSQHSFQLARDLIYTGATRAKELLVVVGHPDALAEGIKKDRSRSRTTLLRQRLCGLEKNGARPHVAGRDPSQSQDSSYSFADKGA